MDTPQTDHPGRLGRTLGTATCLDNEGEGQRLFQVVAGNCCDHALEQASQLMACSRRASFVGVMENDAQLAWASHYLAAMAKALMDDAHGGLLRGAELSS